VVTGRIVGSLAESEAFLVDFRRTVGDLIADNYHGQMTKLANQHGLHYYAEAYGGKSMSEIRSTMSAERNMAEFWWRPDRSALSTAGVKMVAAMTHALGRDIVAAEGFTTVAQDASYQGNPYLLKAAGDLAYASGLTQLYFHAYAHQPFDGVAPGLSMGSTGTSVGRLTTWWPKSGAWLDYLGRCQFMLRQGRAVSDVLCFRMGEIGSFLPERYPTMPDGIDYDIADDTYLKQATASDGALKLPSGASYSVLVLPGTWYADRAFLEKLESFVTAGVTVVGPPPHFPGGLAEVRKLDEVQPIIDRLWPKEKLKGKIRPQTDFAKVLTARKVTPDLVLGGARSPEQMSYIHRRTSDADIYFIANREDKPVSLSADFRIANRQPELWNPLTGKIAPIPAFNAKDGRTTIDLTLGDTGSTFIVFRKPSPAVHATSIVNADNTPASLGRDYELADDGAITLASAGTWRVRLSNGQEATLNTPAPASAQAVQSKWSVTFRPWFKPPIQREYETLASWTASDEEPIKYFSGTATYRTEINLSSDALKPNQRAILDLGVVRDVANIRINSKPAGDLWMPPFVRDVTAQLKPGANVIEVDVTNRWVNRLMGDAKLPQDIVYQNKPMKAPSWGIIESYPDWLKDPSAISKRQRSTFMSYSTSYKPTDVLPESGLIGPVQLKFESTVHVPSK